MIDLKGYYELDKQGIQDCLDAIPKNLKRRDMPIVTTIEGNFDTAEKELVSQALIEWRHGFADPRPALQKAITLAHRAAALLPQAYADAVKFYKPHEQGVKPFESLEAFSFSVAALMNVLLTGAVDGMLLDQFPLPMTLTHRLLSERWFVSADAALAWSLSGRHDRELWNTLLHEISKRKSEKLAHATFSNYLALYEAVEANDVRAVGKLVRGAEQLYEGRKNNRFYKDLGYYEDGNFADYHLDYRVGVILKYAADRDLALVEGIHSVHRWKW